MTASNPVHLTGQPEKPQKGPCSRGPNGGTTAFGSSSPGERSPESPAGIPYNGDTCIVQFLRKLLARVTGSTDACRACSGKLKELDAMLSEISRGEGHANILDRLSSESAIMAGDGHCSAVRGAAGAVRDALIQFGDQFRAHVNGGHCPARECERLLHAPCQLACPAGIDIPSYLALTAHGLYEEALEVIRDENPFAWVCGLICPHPCESACVRGKLDEAVNIRYLKAFVAEQVTSRKRYPASKKPPQNGIRIAVVGSGPAGLTAAHYLALKGYAVTVFEALPTAGGLLMYGIPEYRLPREIVQTEVQSLRDLGVEIRTGFTVGRDASFDDLRKEGFRAFFVAVGAHKGHRIGVPGEEDFPQVYDAISFLRQVNLGSREKPAETVVVVGGGNSAMDAARTCLRLGCREVHVAYRRTRAEMPANPQEVEEAIEEGVVFHFLAIPVRVGGENGQVSWLECLQAELGQPDQSGRRRPIPVQGSNFRLDAGAVVAAIGQQPDYEAFSDDLPMEINPRNQIITKRPGTGTSVDDIFAGGDVVTGPATVVQAIAAGKQAAIDIDCWIRGVEPSVYLPAKKPTVPFVQLEAAEKVSMGRIPLHLADAEARARNFEPVELAFSESEAKREASRCLRCDVCLRCGECGRTCREGMQIGALEFTRVGGDDQTFSNYALPGEKCIACGACAQTCPTGAMQVVESGGVRTLSLCGTVLNRTDCPTCEACGEPFSSERILESISERADSKMGKHVERTLCPKCARLKRAANFVK